MAVGVVKDAAASRRTGSTHWRSQSLPRYLSGCVRPEILDDSRLGLILTPAHGNRPDLSRVAWAADNGCFAQGSRFSLRRYYAWLDSWRHAQSTCLFATAPDVLANARATWERSEVVLRDLRVRGWPAALVAQDGIEDLDVQWEAFDVLFLGGSTRWKLSAEAWAVAEAAQEHGKHLHMGRVNSLRRWRAAQAMGCDSVDGTFLVFGPDRNLPRLRRWQAAMERQPLLW